HDPVGLGAHEAHPAADPAVQAARAHQGDIGRQEPLRRVRESLGRGGFLQERHLRRFAGRGRAHHRALRGGRVRSARADPGGRLAHAAREDARVDPYPGREGAAAVPPGARLRVVVPDFAELLRTLRTWGRWGTDDERGALNYVTADVRRRAAGCVRQGKTFPLAIPIRHGSGPQVGGARINPLHLMTATGCDQSARVDLGMGAGYVDDVLVMMVQGGTQWDALCHVYYDGHLWNGFPATTVDARGAGRGGIDKVHGDFVSRGVLLDVARAQDVECLAPGYPITTADLEATEARQGGRVGGVGVRIE